MNNANLDDEFAALMDEVYPPPSKEAATRQERAIRTLSTMFRAWAGECLVFVSGSYRMGTCSEDGDIDVVFVTTSQVTRDMVFTEFAAVLAGDSRVTDVQLVPGARVPIISLTLFGQEFDMLTCHLRTPTLPARADVLASYAWMNGCDTASMLSFSGPRTTEVLLMNTPNAQAYILAVRFMRYWAKRRALYSNKAGYLGGVNIALLVAWQQMRLEPAASALTIVAHLFQGLAAWPWGSSSPLQLTGDAAGYGAQSTAATASASSAVVPIATGAPPVFMERVEWSVERCADDTMVVLTPCFPRFNSMMSANLHTRAILIAEFRRARDMLDHHGVNQAALAAVVASPQCASSMCVPAAVAKACLPLPVATCSRFMRVGIVAPGTQEGRQWQGYMESQVRWLVLYLSNQVLPLAYLRYIPVWFDGPVVEMVSDCSVRKCTVRYTYIAAPPDNVQRTYVPTGRAWRALHYFISEHADKGPPRPPHGTDVLLDAVTPSHMPPALFAMFKTLVDDTQHGNVQRAATEAVQSIDASPGTASVARTISSETPRVHGTVALVATDTVRQCAVAPGARTDHQADNNNGSTMMDKHPDGVTDFGACIPGLRVAACNDAATRRAIVERWAARSRQQAPSAADASSNQRTVHAESNLVSAQTKRMSAPVQPSLLVEEPREDTSLPTQAGVCPVTVSRKRLRVAQPASKWSRCGRPVGVTGHAALARRERAPRTPSCVPPCPRPDIVVPARVRGEWVTSCALYVGKPWVMGDGHVLSPPIALSMQQGENTAAFAHRLRAQALQNPQLAQQLRSLRGARLGCHCVPANPTLPQLPLKGTELDIWRTTACPAQAIAACAHWVG